MVKAVIFDLDGTLHDRDASIEKFIEYQYERLRHTLAIFQKNRTSPDSLN